MHKLVVLSADALVSEDLDTLKSLPNTRRYLLGGSQITQGRSVYPTITYPCHTTLVTGVYPDRHGVEGNLVFSAQREPLPWKWFHGAARATDLFTAAKRAGRSTAAVFWPVTGNHPDIDFLIDEYWTQGPEDALADAFARSGSRGPAMEIVRQRQGLLQGHEREHPVCDEFVIACACDLLERCAPDLTMIHPANIDGARHRYGAFNERVTQQVIETDRYIGLLGAAMERAGTLADTNFFLVSDHGQMDIRRIVNLNVLLAEAGLIQLDESGQIASWQAYCLSGGMSALVYLKDPSDGAVRERVARLLDHLVEEGVYGVSQVFTAERARREHRLAGDFAFVLETDGYTSFGDSPERPLVKNFDSADYRYGQATHGYLPEKGPQPVLLAKGPDIAPGVTLKTGRLVDEAPTFARLLGADLPGDIDGRVIREILRP